MQCRSHKNRRCFVWGARERRDVYFIKFMYNLYAHCHSIEAIMEWWGGEGRDGLLQQCDAQNGRRKYVFMWGLKMNQCIGTYTSYTRLQAVPASYQSVNADDMLLKWFMLCATRSTTTPQIELMHMENTLYVAYHSANETTNEHTSFDRMQAVEKCRAESLCISTLGNEKKKYLKRPNSEQVCSV